ncbi:MAG: hypothetical protein IJ043_08010 [Clostridia bacterium]|nr:hypothetical protein [Clostridia bacterium]
MRLNYNFNRWCKKMDLEEINYLYGAMTDLKYRLLPVRHIMENDIEKPVTFNLSCQDFIYAIRALNQFVCSRGLEPLFEVPAEDNWSEEVFRSVFSRFDYLMSFPEGEPEMK